MTTPLPPVVFVHVYYPDIWQEMAAELAAAFDRPFGLVLTTCGSTASLALPRTPHLSFVRTIEVENRGRDVLPFLKALNGLDLAFDIGLKLHTKRSEHHDAGDAWRRFLTRSLLAGTGTPDALTLMERLPALGLVAPAAHLLPLDRRIGLNGPALATLAPRLGLDGSPAALERHVFAAGTMFWFRKSALARFRNLDDLFEVERRQTDGTTAHAAERLFAASVENSGFVAASMDAVPILHAICENAAALPDRTTLAAIAAAEANVDNPFSNPIATVLRRHRWLLAAAHHASAHLPPGLWRLARRLFRRIATR